MTTLSMAPIRTVDDQLVLLSEIEALGYVDGDDFLVRVGADTLCLVTQAIRYDGRVAALLRDYGIPYHPAEPAQSHPAPRR